MGGYPRFRCAALILLLYGCETTTPPAAPPPSAAPHSVNLPAPYNDNNVRIVVDGLWKDGSGNVIGVSGTATNTGAANLRFCAVQLGILDAGGIKVSEAYADTSGLQAGQTWRFQAKFRFPYPETFNSIVSGGVGLCQQ